MPRKLNIGGEQAHPEWEIFNIRPADYVDHVGDARDLSRFADETFDEIYASHVLEHFDFKGALVRALKQWHRVLKPGGKIYISVPNLEVLCRFFAMKDEFTLKQRMMLMHMMFGGHESSDDYHYTGFDVDILGQFLAKAGFTRMEPVEEFGIFEDTSAVCIKGVPISLNVIAFK
jgi:predicted SAM-dependent methyltransferase